MNASFNLEVFEQFSSHVLINMFTRFKYHNYEAFIRTYINLNTFFML